MEGRTLFSNLFLAAVAAVIILTLVVHIIHIPVNYRRKELADWCRERGWTFDPDVDKTLWMQYPGIDFLQYGESHYAYNFVLGTWREGDFLACDYLYDKDTTFTVVMVASAIPLKPLFIRPERFSDDVNEFFGKNDIDFESSAFSREFFVTAPDKKWAYDVLHPRMMEYLMASPRLAIQFDKGHVAVASIEGILIPEEIEAALEIMAGMLDRLPEYLVREQMGTV